MAMLARRKGLTLATDYLLALRRRSPLQLSATLLEDGMSRLRNSPLGFGLGVEPGLGIGSRRGISKWIGDGRNLAENQMRMHIQGQQGLALVGRRNFNLASLRDRFKGATGKVKESVTNGADRAEPAELSVRKPVNTAKRTVIGYREAVGLQLGAFWKRNYLVVVGAVGFGVCLLLWRLMFGIVSTFVSLSEEMVKFGFLVLAAAMVAVGGVWLRARLAINLDVVYRMAMRKLNTSTPVLEVMSAPLTGTKLRAYVMSGGGLRIKNFKLRLSNKRCFIIFPISGSERKDLVIIEVQKRRGQYDFNLLAVDILTDQPVVEIPLKPTANNVKMTQNMFETMYAEVHGG